MNNNSTRSLRKLLNDWEAATYGTDHPQPPDYDGPDVELTAIVEHTDHIEPGACFVARVRTGTDGHPYIGKAITGGASLILGQYDPTELEVNLKDVPYLQVEDTAVAEAWLSAAWHGFPSRHLVMIGVTGTDGKSTTVNLLYEILRTAGLKVGMLSTIKAAIGTEDESLALHVTTPEAPVIQAYLRRMVNSDVTHCILEATSHGLAQDRVGAIEFDLAVVTNITHEHLDYHGDYEEYFSVKASLFEGLRPRRLKENSENLARGPEWSSPNVSTQEDTRKPLHWGEMISKSRILKTAVLNRDDESFEQLAKIQTARQITYGIHNPADIIATDITFGPTNTRFTINLPSHPLINTQAQAIPISASLIGEFNIHNMLAATAAAHVIGIDGQDIKNSLEAVKMLAGRMESIDRGQRFLVVVDFAHTPNALAKAIFAARGMAQGRIITVFGSAGKRDVAKRRLMAEISARDADLTVLTAEDPRDEVLDDILATMAAGCRSQGGVESQNFWRVPDRGRAIYFALSLAQPKDLVLICGKGHEQSMCFGVIEYAWDDVEATRTALDAFLNSRPMPDLGLPTFNDLNLSIP